jgi:cytoskeletal protein RodZ
MATVVDLDEREIIRREEWEEREFYEQAEEKRRQHELRVLKQKLKYTTRWRSIVRLAVVACSIIPKSLVVIAITLLLLFARPVPNSLYDYLAS